MPRPAESHSGGGQSVCVRAGSRCTWVHGKQAVICDDYVNPNKENILGMTIRMEPEDATELPGTERSRSLPNPWICRSSICFACTAWEQTTPPKPQTTTTPPPPQRSGKQRRYLAIPLFASQETKWLPSFAWKAELVESERNERPDSFWMRR